MPGRESGDLWRAIGVVSRGSKGGWLKVWEYDRQLQQQKEVTKKLEIRNAGLDAEVRDLKQGYDAIEERARFELGMVRQDEHFVQIPEKVPGK